MQNFKVPLVRTQIVSPIRLTHSKFEEYRPTKTKNCISYEFKVNAANIDQVINRLKRRKTDSYFLMTGAVCLFFFSNLVFGNETAGVLSHTFNVIISVGSTLASLGGAYLLHKQKTTIEKIKLLFGSRQQQQEELINLAKSLPNFAVHKKIQTISVTDV